MTQQWVNERQKEFDAHNNFVEFHPVGQKQDEKVELTESQILALKKAGFTVI